MPKVLGIGVVHVARVSPTDPEPELGPILVVVRLSGPVRDGSDGPDLYGDLRDGDVRHLFPLARTAAGRSCYQLTPKHEIDEWRPGLRIPVRLWVGDGAGGATRVERTVEVPRPPTADDVGARSHLAGYWLGCLDTLLPPTGAAAPDQARADEARAAMTPVRQEGTAMSTHHRTAHAVRASARAAAVTAAALAGAASAQAGDTTHAKASLDVHVVFALGRSTDLRVGEPLQINARGGEIAEVCWSPAPIDRPACSDADTGAPARPGRQHFTVTLTDGTVVRGGRTIRPARRAALPTLEETSDAKVIRPLRYRATCTATAYGSVTNDGELANPTPAADLATGDGAAAYYEFAPGVIQAFSYGALEPAFYADDCLRPVRAGGRGPAAR